MSCNARSTVLCASFTVTVTGVFSHRMKIKEIAGPHLAFVFWLHFFETLSEWHEWNMKIPLCFDMRVDLTYDYDTLAFIEWMSSKTKRDQICAGVLSRPRWKWVISLTCLITTTSMDTHLNTGYHYIPLSEDTHNTDYYWLEFDKTLNGTKAIWEKTD